MTGGVDQPIVSPVLVGRERERAALDAAIAVAATGTAQAVLVAGEAGIGKSRLVSAGIASARALGYDVVQGNCFPQDRACPYAPLLDLLRANGKILTELGPAGSALFPLVPDLVAPPENALPALDPEQERRRLFAALVQVFLHRATRQPLLVVIEDLHWSDETSLEVLYLLMRRGVNHPMLLLLTYRKDEANPVLRHWLARLDRSHLAQEIALTGLAPGEVEAMLRAIFGLRQEPRREFVAEIHAFSQGNPFVVEETMKSLVAAGEVSFSHGTWTRKPLEHLQIPRSLQDAVLQRSSRLSDEARGIARIAAVAGRRFDFAVLQEITGHDEPRLLAAIKELIAAQMVVEEDMDHFAFRHALTRQAIYAELLARERIALHRTVARTIEHRHPGEREVYLSDLAHHFSEAEAWEETLRYAEQAGQRALSFYTPRIAADQFTRALEAVAGIERAGHREMNEPGGRNAIALRLHRARGRAYDTIGDFGSACADYEAALHLAERMDDRRSEWQAVLDLGLLWAARDYVRTGDYYKRALELAQAMDDPAALAESLNRIGNWHTNAERPGEALGYHARALHIFEDLDDPRGMAATHDLLGLASASGGDLGGGRRHSERAVSAFAELDDRQAMVSCLVGCIGTAVYEAETAVSAVPIAASITPAERALALARAIDWPAGEAFAACMLGECLGAQGAYGRALDLLRVGLQIAEEIAHEQWMAQAHWGLGFLHADLLAFPEARAHLERALALGGALDSSLWITMVSGGLASVYIHQGDITNAEALLGGALLPSTPMQTLGQRLLWCAAAELALARHDPERALDILHRLYAHTANYLHAGDVPRLALVDGAALVASGLVSDGEAVLLAAVRVADRDGVRPVTWRLEQALGSLYASQGRADESRAAYAAARAMIDELATTLADAALQETFVQRVTAMFPDGSVPSPRQAAKAAAGGLTAREREVAVEVARGRTNREIADIFSVGERTVEAHVSHILLKLGQTSRTQIATWVTERQLG